MCRGVPDENETVCRGWLVFVCSFVLLISEFSIHLIHLMSAARCAACYRVQFFILHAGLRTSESHACKQSPHIRGRRPRHVSRKKRDDFGDELSAAALRCQNSARFAAASIACSSSASHRSHCSRLATSGDCCRACRVLSAASRVLREELGGRGWKAAFLGAAEEMRCP